MEWFPTRFINERQIRIQLRCPPEHSRIAILGEAKNLVRWLRIPRFTRNDVEKGHLDSIGFWQGCVPLQAELYAMDSIWRRLS